MEIIVEDFINGHQERKVVPDDTVFISKMERLIIKGIRYIK